MPRLLERFPVSTPRSLYAPKMVRLAFQMNTSTLRSWFARKCEADAPRAGKSQGLVPSAEEFYLGVHVVVAGFDRHSAGASTRGTWSDTSSTQYSGAFVTTNAVLDLHVDIVQTDPETSDREALRCVFDRAHGNWTPSK
jgi:hypothetical protein